MNFLVLLQTRWAGGRTSLALSVEIYGATGRGLAWPCAVWNGPQGGDNKSIPLFFMSLPPHKQLLWLVSQLHVLLLAWPQAGAKGTMGLISQCRQGIFLQSCRPLGSPGIDSERWRVSHGSDGTKTKDSPPGPGSPLSDGVFEPWFLAVHVEHVADLFMQMRTRLCA